MLKKETLDFLKKLKENNNREWFSKNKLLYERARADFENLIKQLIPAIASFDPQIGMPDPKKCLFRIYRDVRFSPDKSPYKTHMAAIIHQQNLDRSSGYYLHIGADESFACSGHYMLMPDQLKKMRQGIAGDFEFFEGIINETRFKTEFGDLFRDEDILKRVPNAFAKDHPAAEYLKLKRFYVEKSLSEDTLISDGLVPRLKNIYKLSYPLNEFLNDVLLDD